MNGKQKCAVLKQIRRDIAKANDIRLDIPECSHTGECLGTCPRCESEVRHLERVLDDRKKRGMKIAVAGVSAGLIALSSASCETMDALFSRTELQGDMLPPEGDITIAETMGKVSDTEWQGAVPDTEPSEKDSDTESMELQGVMIAPETLGGEEIPVEVELMGDIPMEEIE